MRHSPFAIVLAPELIERSAIAELPAGLVPRVAALPSSDEPAPASAADGNYRLIPLG